MCPVRRRLKATSSARSNIRTLCEDVVDVDEGHVVSLWVHQGSPAGDGSLLPVGFCCHKAGRSWGRETPEDVNVEPLIYIRTAFQWSSHLLGCDHVIVMVFLVFTR